MFDQSWLGCNVYLQDAHNLAYKLARVHHGLADESLLDQYTCERRPVAVSNTVLSVSNLRRSYRVRIFHEPEYLLC